MNRQAHLVSDETIPCHCCGGAARLARSVMIRGDIFKCGEEFRAKWPDDGGPLGTPRYEAWLRDVERDSRNGTYRRAFICGGCYSRIDADFYGAAEIITDSGPRVFNLAGASRFGRAAIYNYARWRRFQDRLEEAAFNSLDRPTAARKLRLTRTDRRLNVRLDSGEIRSIEVITPAVTLCSGPFGRWWYLLAKIPELSDCLVWSDRTGCEIVKHFEAVTCSDPSRLADWIASSPDAQKFSDESKKLVAEALNGAALRLLEEVNRV